MRSIPDRVLPAETAAAWPAVVAALPAGAYLAGGTALALRLVHRQSRDLDVFVPAAFDTGAVRAVLESHGVLAVTMQDPDSTLNGVLDGARVQFLAAIGQRNLDAPEVIEGMPVAEVRDIFAMKLKVIGDRGELRDYTDIMAIEQQTPHRIEQGLSYYLLRYGLGPHHASLAHIVRSLGYLEDVADDPGLPVARPEVVAYFERRHGEVLRSLDPSLG